MTDGRRQGCMVAIVFFLQIITLSSAKHHKRGQQCRTAWSSVQAHFTYNTTAPAPANSPANHNSTSAPLHIDITGVPWQLKGQPITSTLPPPTPANGKTTPSPPGSPPPVDGLPCMDAGVLFSCSKCQRFLTGLDCYKKTGPEELGADFYKTMKCDEWYTRTGYAEGGGVTMCGSKSPQGIEVFQCSSDKDMTDCEPCVELGATSP